MKATRYGKNAERERQSAHRKLRTEHKKDGTPKRELSKKGSKRRNKQIKRMRRAEKKVARQRATHAARCAARLAKKYDGIAVERPSDLRGLYRGMLRKAVYDASWGVLRKTVRWAFFKVAGVYVEVPAAGTSRDCPACGAKGVFDNALGERRRECACGWGASRDVTSAYEILRRGRPEMLRMRGGGAPRGRNASTGGRVVPETPVRRKPDAGARRRKAATVSRKLNPPERAD